MRVSSSLLLVSVSGLGCASENSAEDSVPAAQTGALSLPLTAVAASGAVYRLRQGEFTVTDVATAASTLLSTEQDPLASTLEASLPSGEYLVALQNGWVLEKAVGNTLTIVAATLLSPAVQSISVSANGESSLFFQFNTNGELVEFGRGQLVIDIEVSESGGAGGAGGSGGSAGSGGFGGGGGGGGGGPVSFNRLIENSAQALQSLSLRSALGAALANAGSFSNADMAYRAIIDSYASSFEGQDPTASHCDNFSSEFGGPGLNGYPLQCGRLERFQINNLDTWFPTAAVNRLDLAAVDGSHCGQQRLVFANDEQIGNGRMLMIIEAQIPNPNPACGVDACLPVAEFWASVDAEPSPTQRGNMLVNAFLGAGIGSGFGPFINANQLGPNGGQIRTNNFNDSPWTLREFHFQPAPFGLPRPAPVGDSPNGQLWNDFSGFSQGSFCRNAFASSLAGLLTDNVSEMSFVVPEQCKDAESRNDFSQDYVSQLNGGSGAFINQLNAQLIGTGLSAQDIAARARFAGSCIGCHQESSGSVLGRGVNAPFQFDFVHVSDRNQVPCDDGIGSCFQLSDALRNEFLPHRQQVMSDFLATSPGCSPPTPPPFAAASAAGLAPVLASGALPGAGQTLGGQAAGAHSH
jgi:hypothetical protein